jgi:transcriptional regulator with XRE-family HTH domain
MHFSGKAAWLAKSLGVSKGSLHEWMHGDHRPSLTWLITLASELGCSATDLLDGNAERARPPRGRIGRRSRSHLKVPAAQHQRIADDLAGALRDSDAPSLKSIAQKLRVNYDFLRAYFPQQSAALIARCRARQSAQKLAKETTLLTAVRAKAEGLAAHGTWPTTQRVMEGIALRSRYDRLRPAINAILTDVRSRIPAHRWGRLEP